jgi:hypothetical protein
LRRLRVKQLNIKDFQCSVNEEFDFAKFVHQITLPRIPAFNPKHGVYVSPDHRLGPVDWRWRSSDVRIIERNRKRLQHVDYLNVTDEELRRGLEVSWNNKGRPLRLASGA